MMKRKNNYLVQRYKLAKKRFEKFSERFEKALERGVSRQELHFFNLRLSRLGKKLARFEQKLKLGVASLAFSGLMLGGNIEAEAQTRIPAFNFVNANPFGLTTVNQSSKPTFTDLDSDGDLDAFIGEDFGNIVYFENTGSNTAPAFAAASNNPFGLTKSTTFSSPTFVDLDNDGDLDAFVGEVSGNIRYFENTGDSKNPTFATVSNNPFGLTAVGGFPVPVFADLDSDGDLDAFIGDISSNVRYFENTGDSKNAAFATVSDNPFGLTDLGTFGANSTPAFADLDNDGDLDVILGEQNGYKSINYFENTGNKNAPAFSSVVENPFGFVDSYLYYSPSFADLDGDGDLDAFIGNATGNILYFENTGTKLPFCFNTASTNLFGLTDVGSYSKPTFADLDGDGDLDAFVGEVNGNINYFENTGTSIAPDFSLSASASPFGLTDVGSYSIPTFADLDGDGDLDAFVGESLGNIKYFENTGTPIAPAFSLSTSASPFGLTGVGSYSKSVFADLDGDGDLDAFVGESLGNIKYFENTGTPIAPAFSLSTSASPFGLADVGQRSTPSFADLNGDGDLDAFVGATDGTIFYFENLRNIIWDGSAWNNATGPVSNDATLINGNFDTNTNGAITANKFVVNSTFTLTIADGDAVTVAGDLANSGTILVQNNGAFVQTKATPTNSGTGTYTSERLADKSILVYNYFSSPVIGETVADIFATNGTNFYSFDVASQNWSALATATVLGAGDGFAATGNGNSGTITRTFTSNTGFNSGDITKAITIVGTGGAADDDWNLVGNPYPSGLDFQSFYTSNSANIGTAIYLWDSDGNDVGATDADYATMTSAGAVNSGAGGTTYPNAIVASGQGFFVEALNNANITFSNSHRSATNNTFFREKEMQRVWLSAKHENGAGNQILIAFAENADEKSDLFDGKKWSESQTLSFYMPVSDFTKGVDSEKLAIQGLPSIEEGRIVELGIEAKQAGKFTFALDKSEYLENQAIFLHDLLTNEFINITKESYTVVLEEGDHSDRFTLRFVGSKVTGVEEDLAERGVSIYSSGQRLTINFADAQSAEANIAVYDLQGRKLFATSVENQTQVSLELPLSGIFIVKVENARGVATKKVYLD